MASTRASSEDRVGGIADRQHHREGADDGDRHRDQGISVVRSFAEEQEHHDATSTKASTRVRITSLMVDVTKTVVSKNRL